MGADRGGPLDAGDDRREGSVCMMDYTVSYGNGQVVKWYASEAGAREYAQRLCQEWAETGVPRVPAVRVLYGGEVLAVYGGCSVQEWAEGKGRP